MAHSFREIIDFSKNIPEFKELALQDQIALIKGSCIEMLFIKVCLTFEGKILTKNILRLITLSASTMKRSSLEILPTILSQMQVDYLR